MIVSYTHTKKIKRFQITDSETGAKGLWPSPTHLQWNSATGYAVVNGIFEDPSGRGEARAEILFSLEK